MKKSELLTLLSENGALVIHAHPFREAQYIDHIRLFPRHVHGVEVYNACRNDFENGVAELYAKQYGLPRFAGSDNHVAGKRPMLGGMCSTEPISDELDFVRRYKNGELETFVLENEQ
jgi:predicted metal-dependent phosphoesterase TrpH